MICPECKSREPQEAKFCGICGTPLTQEGRVKHFLTDMPEDNARIDIPHHRRPLFYVAISAAVILTLAVLGGIGFLLYRVVWGDGDSGSAQTTEAVEENSFLYEDQDLGFSFMYPRLWVAQELAPSGKIAAVNVSVTSTKYALLTVTRLSPDVTIGGWSGIEAYVRNQLKDVLTPASTQTGTQPGATSQNQAAGQAPTLEKIQVNGTQALYIKYDQGSGESRITIQRYFLAPSELLFEFQFSAPADEWSAVSPDFALIIQSFQVNSDGG